MAVARSQAIADLPEGGLIYEPRSLWSIQTVELQAGPPDSFRFRFNREHFRNGGRYPITLERIAVAPINYAFRETPTTVAPQRQWQSTRAVLSSAKIAVSVPFRQHYSKRTMILGSLAAQPTGEPEARPFAVEGGEFVLPSGLWSVTALNFSRPVFIPRLGSLEWHLSSGNRYITGRPFEITAHMLFEEEGGLLPGSARTFRFDVAELSTVGRYPAGVFPQQPNVGWPFVPDGFADLAAAGTTAQFWDSVGQFSSKDFKAQEATRDGSTLIKGMRVLLDQTQTDNQMTPGVPIAPASMRIGSRIRTTGGGSQEWWWREGAPLCLTLDTITPAVVYKLPMPITLAKGDSLDVELEVPAVTGVLPVDIRRRGLNVGISFNGWAAIEG